MPTTFSTFLPLKKSTKPSIASLKAAASSSKGVMSRNLVPGVGKSLMSRILALRCSKFLIVLCILTQKKKGLHVSCRPCVILLLDRLDVGGENQSSGSTIPIHVRLLLEREGYALLCSIGVRIGEHMSQIAEGH